MPTPRTLALDIGNRRIGVAITDELVLTAQPLLTIYRGTLRADLKSIARLIRRYDVATVLIGLPLHASGDASSQSAKTEAFAEALRAHLAEALASPPQLVLIDERHTTAEAHALLDQSSGTRASSQARKNRSAMIDQVAAVLLLESWLRQKSPALLPDPEAKS